MTSMNMSTFAATPLRAIHATGPVMSSGVTALRSSSGMDESTGGSSAPGSRGVWVGSLTAPAPRGLRPRARGG
jgi:hypothetical protein